MAKDVKFIIFCYPRTGSTLLIRTLGLYPGITNGMEIFNPILVGKDPWVVWRRELFEKIYGIHESYLKPNKYMLDGHRFDLSVLSEYVFEKYNGVKIIYDQLDKDSNVWDHILSIKNLKIIFLQRNIIDSAISFRIAEETNQWQKWSENQTFESPSFYYDPAWFDWFYDHFCSAESFYKKMFSDHDCLTIPYENMINNWDSVIELVHQHLGLKHIPVSKSLFKRTEGSQKDLIKNYTEVYYYHMNRHLGKYFRHTIKL